MAIKKLEFSSNFLWGGAAWAPGFEGARFIDGKTKDTWDLYFEEYPDEFYKNIGPNETIDFYHRYEEYIDLMKQAGYNSFRFSVSWTRFIDIETGEINTVGAQYYLNVINYCWKVGIEPILCLSHFDLPVHLEKDGGWLNQKTAEEFCDYAEKVLKYFNGKINIYFVFNEVAVIPEQAYYSKRFLPLHSNVNEMVQCAYNMLLTQARVVKIFREEKIEGKIGTILNPNPVYPRSDSEDDLKAANLADLLFERPYLEASLDGQYSEELLSFYTRYELMPQMASEDKDIIKANTVDIIGINYYSPKRVKASRDIDKDCEGIDVLTLFDDYEMPDREFNFSRGWEIFPQGIYDMLMKVKNEYNNIECMITENGMGIEKEEEFIKEDMVQDDYRIDFYKRHLYYVHKAIQEGSNCIGFHMWAPLDNWSPLNTFKNRYGLYRYNLEDKTMAPKKSRDWFKEVATRNQLEYEGE